VTKSKKSQKPQSSFYNIKKEAHKKKDKTKKSVLVDAISGAIGGGQGNSRNGKTGQSSN
jgi:hypothetical protein